MLALKGRHAGYGWVLFAFSNAGWIGFANGHGHWFLFAQQVDFSITSCIGIWNHILVPAIDRHFDQLVNEVAGL